MYEIRYFPSFSTELYDILDYISNDLGNPVAAANLYDDTVSAINKRADYPFTQRPFFYSRKDGRTYYSILVKNYYVLYTLNDNAMEIRHFQYSRRNITELI